MKRISLYSLLVVVGLTTILACGESEQERMAREQARQDSLRKVEMAKVQAQIQAYEDSVAAAEQSGEMMEDDEDAAPKAVNEFAMVESGPYVVQVGAFRSQDKAQHYVDKWADRSYPSSYVIKTGNEATGDVWFRVRVGYFSTTEDAENFGAQLAKEINSGYWVANKD